jgi:hypothetical protein
MPKRYRIEMTLFDDEAKTQVGPPDKHKENYETEEEAKAKFAEKKDAAREAGKGHPPV